MSGSKFKNSIATKKLRNFVKFFSVQNAKCHTNAISPLSFTVITMLTKYLYDILRDVFSYLFTVCSTSS